MPFLTSICFESLLRLRASITLLHRNKGLIHKLFTAIFLTVFLSGCGLVHQRNPESVVELSQFKTPNLGILKRPFQRQPEVAPGIGNQAINSADMIESIQAAMGADQAANQHFFNQTAIQPPAAIQVPNLGASQNAIAAIQAANEAARQNQTNIANGISSSDLIAIAEAEAAKLRDTQLSSMQVPKPSTINVSNPLPSHNSQNTQANLLNKTIEQGQVAAGGVQPLSQVSSALRSAVASADSKVRSVYASRKNAPLWYSSTGWTPAAKAAQQTLLNSDHDGLPMRRYAVAGDFSILPNSSPADVAAADVMMTQAAMMFLVDLTDGLDPSKRRSSGKARVVKAAGGNWDAYVESLRPKNKQYQGLARAMRTQSFGFDELRKMMINMERFRHYKDPHENKYVSVNLPTQRLSAMDKSNQALSMRVVVGQLSRQTPVMKDRIVDLKFSPDWSVPNSIADKDIIPILAEKGSSLTKSMNMKIYKGKRLVDADKENWSKARASSYRFRQMPGPKNALGGVRFSLTNPRGIYLHDTPSRDLFANDTRTVSSGCVRVGDAVGLSQWLLKSTSGWNAGKIDTAMKSGKTKSVRLKYPVPVYFTYHTAHIDGTGQLQFGSDIYGLDDTLAMMLGL